jgi:hypothetical protein
VAADMVFIGILKDDFHAVRERRLADGHLSTRPGQHLAGPRNVGGQRLI